MATAAQPNNPLFTPFPPPADPVFEHGLSTFLHRPVQLTIVPQLYPNSQQNLNAWYPDSQAIEMTGIIDACLHNQYDVPRAKTVFARLRAKAGNRLLTTSLYNAFLEAYVGMAQNDKLDRRRWIRDAWALYKILESGSEQVHPNSKTYSVMLFLWHQYVFLFLIITHLNLSGYQLVHYTLQSQAWKVLPLVNYSAK